MRRRGWLIALIASGFQFGVLACVAPQPFTEYTIARAAVSSAKDAGSEKLAPGLWHQAQQSYRSGQKLLADRDNESAKQSFTKAIEYAEKAENASRLKRFESGESF